MKPTSNKRPINELSHDARTRHPHPYSNYATNGAFQLEAQRLESRTSYNSSFSSTATTYGSSFAVEGSFDWNERYGSNTATTTRAFDHHSRNVWDNGAPFHSGWYCNSSPPPLPVPTNRKSSLHQHQYNPTSSSNGLTSLPNTWLPSLDTKVLPTTCEVCCERKNNLQYRSVGTMTCGDIEDTLVDVFAKNIFNPPADELIPTGPFIGEFPPVDVETPRSLTMLFTFEDNTMYCPETTQNSNDEWSVTSQLPKESELNIALKITNDTSSEEEDWESILTEISPEKRRLRPRRKCTFPDCGNRVVQGGLCISHGAKRKPCGFPNCPKFVKHAGMCSAHGPRRKRCFVGGCDKASVQRGMCIAHGAKKKLCLTEGCERQGVVKGMCKRHRVEEGTKSV